MAVLALAGCSPATVSLTTDYTARREEGRVVVPVGGSTRVHLYGSQHGFNGTEGFGCADAMVTASNPSLVHIRQVDDEDISLGAGAEAHASVFVVTALGEGDVTLLGDCDGVEASVGIKLVPWEERP